MKIRKMSQIAVIFLAIWLIFSSVSVSASYKPPFEVNSRSAYLVNMDTGICIYEKNAREITYPASLTKIVTALVALDQVEDLENTVVTVPGYIFDEFYGLGVSTADIRRGEEVRMIDMLYALLLQSACEAASAIADYVCPGDIPRFVEMMNEKTAEIGATDTHFTNPHGLFHEEQVTTAYDMYLIASYAMENPTFAQIATTTSYLMPATNKHSEPRYVVHTNLMLSQVRGGKMYYEGMQGIKTGTLDEVGKNLTSIAGRDGYHYMLVTLGAPTKDENGKSLSTNLSFVDAKALYDWAFEGFSQRNVLRRNQIAGEVRVEMSDETDHLSLYADQDVVTLLPVDVDTSAILHVAELPESVTAPVKKGDVIGTLSLRLNDEEIGKVNLIAGEDVERSVVLFTLDLVKRFFKRPLVIALCVLLGLLILILFVLALHRGRQAHRRAERMRKRRQNYRG